MAWDWRMIYRRRELAGLREEQKRRALSKMVRDIINDRYAGKVPDGTYIIQGEDDHGEYYVRMIKKGSWYEISYWRKLDSTVHKVVIHVDEKGVKIEAYQPISEAEFEGIPDILIIMAKIIDEGVTYFEAKRG